MVDGKPDSEANRPHNWHQETKPFSNESAYWCDLCDMWVDLGTDLPTTPCTGIFYDRHDKAKVAEWLAKRHGVQRPDYAKVIDRAAEAMR